MAARVVRSDVWKGYSGMAVHNRLASYWRHLLDEIDHGLCNVHLLRNLEEIVEWEKEPDGWVAYMQRWLLKARDGADRWCEVTDGPVPTLVRTDTAAAWDACLEPVLDLYERLPPPARGRRRGPNRVPTAGEV